MFHYIKGVVTDVLPGMVVIECGGIGYEVNVPDGCAAILSAGSGEPVTLYTVMAVKEDDVSLYGFSEKDDLTMFRLLITVSGVGAKGALAMMSALPGSELGRAIAGENISAITRANGIGKKIAQRVVLELKEKVKTLGSFDITRPAASEVKKDSLKSQAAQALMALGFTRTEALTALAGLPDEGLTTEEYIRQALKNRG